MPFTTHADRASMQLHLCDARPPRRLAAITAAVLSLSMLPVTTANASASPDGPPPLHTTSDVSLVPSSPDAVRLRMVASASASVGDVVPVEVWADGIGGAAAFEVVASVAPDAGRIVAASTDEALHREDLSIGDVTGFGVLAAYSSDARTIRADSARLGVFDVRLDTEGRVSIDLGAAMLVDADGNEIAIGDVSPASILVGASASSRPAPAMPWSLSPRTRSESSLDWDLAAVAVASEVEMEWQSSRLDREPCRGEIAGQLGGCVDIGDVQRVAVMTAALRAAAPRVTEGATRQGPVRLTVNARTDEPDDRIGDGVCADQAGRCTLRAAIQEANAIPGRNRIAFAIPGDAPYRITTSRRLPVINDATGRLVINGYSQRGARPNTARRVSNARIRVEVVGAGASSHDGFAIRSGGNVLRGLSVHSFRRSVWIFRTGEGARGNRIVGCFIGTDPAGQYRETVQVDFAHGIHIEQGSPNTRIGGRKRASRNVISGNAYHGIGVWHQETDGTVIRNNIIGLSPLGDRRLANQEHGIDMNYGVSGSVIGGERPNHRNVISGNNFNGIEVSHRAATRNNLVVGNFIGTDVTGKNVTDWTGNGGSAMWIEDGASSNIVVGNVMGGNADGGVQILNNGSNGTSSENVVRNNWIGVSKGGRALPQGGAGVHIEGASNLIQGNVIANQQLQGISVAGPFARYNTFSRNRIHHNGGLSIDIAPLGAVNPNDPGDSDTGPNAMLNFPVLADVTSTSVRGTACAGCVVEVFATGPEGGVVPGYGPALVFLGTAVADEEGRFEVTFTERPAGAWLSSTATNLTGSTSEMSANVQIPGAG